MSRMFAFIAFVFKRTIHHRAILLPVLLGVLAVVTVLCSVPLFATAAADADLRTTINTPGPAITRNLEIRFFAHARDTASYAQATQEITANVQYYLGRDLATQAPIREAEMATLPTYRAGMAHKVITSLFNGDLWFVSAMTPAHITLMAGRLPSPDVTIAPTSEGTAYEVEGIVPAQWTAEFGITLNETLDVTDVIDAPPAFLRVHIVGIFKPNNENDSAWFNDTEPFDPSTASLPIWLSEAAFNAAVPRTITRSHVDYIWFYYLNLNTISVANAPAVLNHLIAVKNRFQLFKLETSDPRVSYEALSELDAFLQTYLSRSFFVTVSTLVAVLPGLMLLLLYIGLAAAALAERNRDEIELMKSRGASPWQVLGFSGMEALLLCGLALLIAPLLATQATSFVASVSFIGEGLGASANLLRTPTGQEYLYASVAVVLCLLTLLLPALAATRSSFATVKRSAARPSLRLRAARLAPVFVLLALGAFGLYVLEQRRVFFTQDTRGNLSVDWVASLSPTLLLLGAAGLGLLLLPLLLSLLDRLARRIPSISVSLAARQMARRPMPYSRLALLLTLTLALGVFASLFSGTLLNSAEDRAAYQSGSDLRLVEGSLGASDLARRAAPLADHLALLPGVTDGMNVLRVENDTYPSGILKNANVTLLGVDSTRFARVAYWRSDFADESVSALMDALQGPATLNGALPALVDDRLLLDTGAQIGSPLTIQLDFTTKASFVIVGTFHYFPTLDTSQYAIVSDLTPLLQMLNQENPQDQVAPNEVWLKLAPNAPEYTADQVANRLVNNPQHRQVIVTVQQAFDRVALLNSFRNDPLHFSLAGALLLDFIVAALLSVVGFVVLFALIAQRRAFEFGVLRAMGLSLRQLGRSLSWEQVILLCVALAAGVALGSGLASLTLPALATDDMGKALLPPFAVHLDGQSLLQLGLFLLACALAVVAASIIIFRRLRVQEVLRLGEE